MPRSSTARPPAAKFQPPADPEPTPKAATGKAGTGKAGAAKAGPVKAAPGKPVKEALAKVVDVSPVDEPDAGDDSDADDPGAGIVGQVTVDGVLVDRVELVLSPLSDRHGFPVYFNTLRLYTLQDERKVFACADCPDVAGTRGDIRVHRVAEHGAAQSGHRKRPVAHDGSVDPHRLLTPAALSMSVGELLRLATAVDGFEDLLAAVETERDDALAAIARERELRLAAEKETGRVKRLIGRLKDSLGG
jgi:hypothetical protein